MLLLLYLYVCLSPLSADFWLDPERVRASGLNTRKIKLEHTQEHQRCVGEEAWVTELEANLEITNANIQTSHERAHATNEEKEALEDTERWARLDIEIQRAITAMAQKEAEKARAILERAHQELGDLKKVVLASVVEVE